MDQREQTLVELEGRLAWSRDRLIIAILLAFVAGTVFGMAIVLTAASG